MRPLPAVAGVIRVPAERGIGLPLQVVPTPGHPRAQSGEGVDAQGSRGEGVIRARAERGYTDHAGRRRCGGHPCARGAGSDCPPERLPLDGSSARGAGRTARFRPAALVGSSARAERGGQRTTGWRPTTGHPRAARPRSRVRRVLWLHRRGRSSVRARTGGSGSLLSCISAPVIRARADRGVARSALPNLQTGYPCARGAGCLDSTSRDLDAG